MIDNPDTLLRRIKHFKNKLNDVSYKLFIGILYQSEVSVTLRE